MLKIFCISIAIINFMAPASGAVLHISNYYKVQLSEQKQSSPSLAISTPSGKTYYASLATECGPTKIMHNGSAFGICNEKTNFDYTRLEYLESDGHQCIDTGIIPTGTMSFEIKTYVAVAGVTSAGQVPLGARTHIDKTEWYYSLSTFYERSNGYFAYGPGSGNFINAYLAFKDINTVSFVSGVYTINEDTKHTYDIVEYPSTFQNTLYMFCLNSKGSQNQAPDYFNGKIYYLKIWDKDKMLRDYIPVLDPDGIPAMYDRISGQFFYNRGTGNFKYK